VRGLAGGRAQLEQIVGAMDASRPLVVLCLQAELPSQSAEWTEPLVLKKGDDAFLPYYQPLTDAAAAAGHASTPEFMHFGVEDFHTPTLPALQGLVVELAKRLEEDSAQLYIHCWGGRGRAGTVSLISVFCGMCVCVCEHTCSQTLFTPTVRAGGRGAAFARVRGDGREDGAGAGAGRLLHARRHGPAALAGDGVTTRAREAILRDGTLKTRLQPHLL
jgi:hypothetical protein